MRELNVNEMTLVSGGQDEEPLVQDTIRVTGTRGGGGGGFNSFTFDFSNFGGGISPFSNPAGFGDFGGGTGLPAGLPSEPTMEERMEEMEAQMEEMQMEIDELNMPESFFCNASNSVATTGAIVGGFGATGAVAAVFTPIPVIDEAGFAIIGAVGGAFSGAGALAGYLGGCS